MGLFKKFKESIEDAQKQLKESIEGAQKQFMENLDDAKNQVLGKQKDIFGLQRDSSTKQDIFPEKTVLHEQPNDIPQSRLMDQKQEVEDPPRAEIQKSIPAEGVTPHNTDIPKPVFTEEKQVMSEVHSSGMFSDRIEKLIEAALQDGVLTDKEEEILKRRVEKEGEDWDEVEMYIQSILQKRQQELSKEANLTQRNQEVNDMNYEQKRAQTLRKCPKCGAYIPHLSNVCPDCGFIIEKNDTDKKISTLISLLRTCIEKVYVRGLNSCIIDIRSNSVVINKDIYDMLPNCYILNSDQSGMNTSTVKVDYDRSGIITEANMYSENDTINSMLFKLHRKEKELLIFELKKFKREYDEAIAGKRPRLTQEAFAKRLYSGLNVIKDYYDIMDNAEISAIEAECSI